MQTVVDKSTVQACELALSLFRTSITVSSRNIPCCGPKAARAIVHDLVAKEVAIYAEMTLTCLTLISRAFASASFHARSLPVCLDILSKTCFRPISGGHRWEMLQAAKALQAVNLLSSMPGDGNPVPQGKEMVVASSQMRGQYQGQVT